MNNNRKQIIVQALIKLVQSAPDAQTQTFIPYSWGNQTHIISEQEYRIWIDYVYSVLDTTYGYTGLNSVLNTKMNVMQVASQSGSYMQLILQIKNEILGLAQEVLQYY